MRAALFSTGVMATLGLWVAISGCRHTGAMPRQTRSGFAFVPPPPPPLSTTGKQENLSIAEDREREVFVEARPISPLAPPDYPAAARNARAGLVNIGVRLTVDAEGRVAAMTPSVTAFSLPPRFSNEFQAAIEVAVAQWRFRPAELRRLEEVPGSEGGTYWRQASSEKIETTLDMIFTFSEAGEVLAPGW